MATESTVVLAFLGGSMSGGEILLVLLAILLLFGSKNLPSVARNLGKSLEAFRRASREVTDEIMRSDIRGEPEAGKRASGKAPELPDGGKQDEAPGIRPHEKSVGRHEPPVS